MNNSIREIPNNKTNRSLNLYHKLNSKRSSTLNKETSEAHQKEHSILNQKSLKT